MPVGNHKGAKTRSFTKNFVLLRVLASSWLPHLNHFPFPAASESGIDEADDVEGFGGSNGQGCVVADGLVDGFKIVHVVTAERRDVFADELAILFSVQQTFSFFRLHSPIFASRFYTSC